MVALSTKGVQICVCQRVFKEEEHLKLTRIEVVRKDIENFVMTLKVTLTRNNRHIRTHKADPA